MKCCLTVCEDHIEFPTPLVKGIRKLKLCEINHLCLSICGTVISSIFLSW